MPLQDTDPTPSFGGFGLRWDTEEVEPPESSYVYRVTEDIRRQSDHPPASILGPNWPVRILYAMENESLYEIVNFTVHGFLLMAMERAKDGYVAYWAIYVKNSSWFTPLYMTLIDPFRRVFVYPPVIKAMEEGWTKAYGQLEESHATPGN